MLMIDLAIVLCLIVFGLGGIHNVCSIAPVVHPVRQYAIAVLGHQILRSMIHQAVETVLSLDTNDTEQVLTTCEHLCMTHM